MFGVPLAVNACHEFQRQNGEDHHGGQDDEPRMMARTNSIFSFRSSIVPHLSQDSCRVFLVAASVVIE